jgi:DNA-binding transcriptional ArsR family regulator
MSDTWDAAGYVASSRYRLAVCEYLSEKGPGLPSEIATETELAQPHVSRALSELRERDVVELLVPESQQKGRLYDLTHAGRVALDRLSRGRNAVDVEVVGREGFPYEGLVEYLEVSHGGVAQAVAAYDGEVVFIHFFGSAPTDRRTAPIARLWSLSGPDGELSSDGSGPHEFTVYGLENLTLVDLAVDGDGSRVGVSLDDEADVPLRSFVEELEANIRA